MMTKHAQKMDSVPGLRSGKQLHIKEVGDKPSSSDPGELELKPASDIIHCFAVSSVSGTKTAWLQDGEGSLGIDIDGGMAARSRGGGATRRRRLVALPPVSC